MELIGTIDKKFVVDGNTIKLAVTVSASKDVLSFIKDVAGMRCDMYVDARYPEEPAPASPAETPDDGQKAMFDENGNPITPEPDEPGDAGVVPPDSSPGMGSIDGGDIDVNEPQEIEQ